MNPREVSVLADLPKVEVARLIPSLDVVSLGPGELLGPENGAHEAVYYIRDGRAELVAELDDDIILLVGLGPGASFGPLVPEAGSGPERLRARTPLKLVRIARDVFHEMCLRYPEVTRSVSRDLASRVGAMEKELIRTKLILSSHASELWSSQAELEPPDPPFQPALTAAAAAFSDDPDETMDHATPATQRVAPGRLALRGTAAASLVLIILYQRLTGAPGESTVAWVLAWGAFNWYLGTLPDYGVALAMTGGLAAMQTAPPQVLLSGFTSETWFLVLGIYGLAAAINRTGLLYRAALFVLRQLPPTYLGQALALSLTGLMLTPALPSSNGRVTMASPMAQELAAAMRLAPRGPASSGLALSVLHGFGQMFFLFMNGTGNCLVVWGLLPPDVRESITWFRWFYIALPLGLIVFVAFMAALAWLIPNPGVSISRRVLDIQAATLGPMSQTERTTLWVTVGMLLAFILQPLHGLHPAWPAIGGLLVLMAVRIVDRTAFVTQVDWASLILFGALWSLAGIIRHAGLDIRLGHAMSQLLEPVATRAWLFLVVLGIVTYGVRLVIPWESAIPLMMVAATPALVAAGYNPFIGGLVILATSNPFFVPQQNVVYLTVYQGTGEHAITHRQATRFGLLHAAITLGAIMLSSVYWEHSGVLYMR